MYRMKVYRDDRTASRSSFHIYLGLLGLFPLHADRLAIGQVYATLNARLKLAVKPKAIPTDNNE